MDINLLTETTVHSDSYTRRFADGEITIKDEKGHPTSGNYTRDLTDVLCLSPQPFSPDITQAELNPFTSVIMASIVRAKYSLP